MQKKNYEIVLVIKKEILTHLKCYLIIFGMFLIGILVGVFFVNQTKNKEEISKYITTYIDEIKSIEEADYIGELNKDIKQNLLLVFIMWFSGTTIVGIPIVFGLIIFRGFCFGYTIASCVYALGKIKGIIFILLSIFMQNIIFIPALMILGVSSVKLYKSIVKDRRKENIKISIFKHCIISALILIILIFSSIIKIGVSYKILIMNLIKYF